MVTEELNIDWKEKKDWKEPIINNDKWSEDILQVLKKNDWLKKWFNNLELSQSLSDDFHLLLEESNSITPTIVEVSNMRDTKEYSEKEILFQLVKCARRAGIFAVWMANLSITDKYDYYIGIDKQVDGNGNIISMSLKWRSKKYGNCYARLNFIRNCSYWKKWWSDKTCIIEECYDDDSFDIPFDAQIVYSY